MNAPTFDAIALTGLTRVNAAVPAPCGTWLAVSTQRLDAEHGSRWVSDLWRVDLDPNNPGDPGDPGDPALGEPLLLTVGEHSDKAPCFRSDGSLGFLSNRPLPTATSDADEARNQVWLLPAAGGEARPLTDEPLGVSAFRFAADAPVMVVLTSVLPDVAHGAQRQTAKDTAKHGSSALHYHRMPVRFWDHWLGPRQPHLVAYSDDGGERRDLTQDAGEALRETTWDLRADGAQVAVCWAVPNADDRIEDKPIALIDTATGARRLVGGGAGVVNAAPRFSPDGGRLAAKRYTRTPAQYGPMNLWIYDTGANPDSDSNSDGAGVALAWDRWPTPWAWSADGARVLVSADDRGQHTPFWVNAHSGQVDRVVLRADLSQAAGGSFGGLSVTASGQVIAIGSSVTAPPEVFALAPDHQTPARALTALSGLDPAESAAATVQSVQVAVGGGGGGGAGADEDPQRRMQAFIVSPATPVFDSPRTFLWIHGGPVSAWNNGWHWRWAPLLLAKLGYTIVLPNPAGSTGFGTDWANGIWGNTWGDRCFKDLMALADHLEAACGLPSADTICMGGSFGGYMTNWIGTQTDRFRGLIPHASLAAMTTFYGVTDVPTWWSLMWGLSPFDDWDAFDRYAPIRQIAQWQTPALILHGAKDFRVPVGESLLLFEALQHHGVDSSLVIFPDENHWILKPRNIVTWYQTVLDWVAKRWDDGPGRT